MSSQEKRSKTTTFDWIFWLKWVLASTLGWVVGLLLPRSAGMTIGALVGIAQWIVLRPLFRQSGWWILASAVGWAASYTLLSMVLPVGDVFLYGGVIGVTIGAAQWLVLRRWASRSGWWVAISTLGWAVGPILGTSLTGAVVGATTGLALELLRQHARPEAG
ncbi:MAG: hypothetical protein P8189_27075 [Anaerolineae bacterium]|jgi:hypothetical protein